MNNFFANLIRYGNGVFAVLVILFFVLLHGFSEEFKKPSISGLGVGLVYGVVFATLLCGTLAIILSIRTELIKIRELLEKK
jgi:hypothetical protein